jgi:DNA-binding HxlR family transcriptional regulator
MKGKRATLADDTCAIARALEVVGDWWSLLIVRDALFGATRFSQFQRSLGLAKTVLSQRLRKLVDHGVLELVDPGDGGSHLEYRLTESGKALHVVLTALWQWGNATQFKAGEARNTLCDRRDQKPLQSIALVAHDGRKLGARDTTVIPARTSRRRRAE